jgi:thiamine-phosphate pyrophosphorylase
MHKYLPKIYHFIDSLNIDDIKSLNKKVALIYRNYSEKPQELKILKFRNYCKEKNIKFLISNYLDLAIKFKLDGFYIPSFNKKYIYSLKKKPVNFIIAGSAHNAKEIYFKEKQGVQLIFLSPLFNSKKSNRPLGLYRYNLLANQTKLPTIALGGIEKKNLKLLKLVKTKGFASISFFKK